MKYKDLKNIDPLVLNQLKWIDKNEKTLEKLIGLETEFHMSLSCPSIFMRELLETVEGKDFKKYLKEPIIEHLKAKIAKRKRLINNLLR